MYKPKVSSQNEYELVSIDELVPDEHLLRLIDKDIDFTFLLEKVRPFYIDDNGRPSDPLILFKMMCLGFIYCIRSKRQLKREIKMNIVYRWFLGLKFHDPVTHHSTIVQQTPNVDLCPVKISRICSVTLITGLQT